MNCSTCLNSTKDYYTTRVPCAGKSICILHSTLPEGRGRFRMKPLTIGLVNDTFLCEHYVEALPRPEGKTILVEWDKNDPFQYVWERWMRLSAERTVLVSTGVDIP